MSTGWQWTIGLLLAGAYIWLWASSEFDLSQEARLDRHYYARVALEDVRGGCPRASRPSATAGQADRLLL